MISDPAFLDEVNRKAGLLRQKLEGLVASHPEVFESVRGVGLMLGLKCKAMNTDIVKAGYAEDLLTVPAADNVIRLLPPLNISDAEITEAVARLDRAATRDRNRIGSQNPKFPGRKAQPAPIRIDESRPMNHFLDIHKTDPADLRAMIDAARAHERRPRRQAQGHAATPNNRSPAIWSR